MSISYAGTYELKPLASGWSLLLVRGRAIGAWKGRGGVYAAAQHFNV